MKDTCYNSAADMDSISKSTQWVEFIPKDTSRITKRNQPKAGNTKNTTRRKKMDLSKDQREELFTTLRARFEKNLHRHNDIKWANVQSRLEANPAKLWSLSEMERTGGEPDVVGYEKTTNEYIFFDCSPESPIGRRNTCYDREALDSRKANKPEKNALEMASTMGTELLTEDQYRQLQQIGNFDTKTSSWLMTPPGIRKLGGAIFGDRRYNHVFIYHNGADSYYAARGFRSSLRV